MANDLIVSSTDEGLRIAVLQDRRLVEVHTEKSNNYFSVGDVFLGRVKQIVPSLQAAFVDVGHSRDAFLHYTDLGPQIKTQSRYVKSVVASRNNINLISRINRQDDINKHGSIKDVLKVGQYVLVQVMKEAISTKGPRLSSQLAIPGEYLIMMPFGDEVSVSRKFKNHQEKVRLKQLLDGIRPNNVGLIVRTAAEGVEFDKLKDDLHAQLDRWDELVNEMAEAKPPKKVLSEIDRASSILRDTLSIGFDNIYVDDDAIHNDISEYLDKYQPSKKKTLQLKKARGGLFDYFGVEKQIKAAFGKNVNLSNGSYLVIEHTEALHVIDVNSGSQRLSEKNPEDNAVAINLEAAAEVARQLRLRDMGGIIVVDFIDMRRIENKRKVFERMRKEMSRDHARHTVLPMSRFGLMQITRQRVRPEVTITTEEICPACLGTGKVQPTILMVDTIEKNIDFLIKKNKLKKLKVMTNPYVAAYLKTGFPSLRQKWFLKYRKWIRVEANSAAPFTSVRYFDEHDEEIRLD